MQNLSIASAIALLAISTTIASRQASASQPTPIPQSRCANHGVTDWSGFYAGAHVGAGFRSELEDLVSILERHKKRGENQQDDGHQSSDTQTDEDDSPRQNSKEPATATVSYDQDDRIVHAGIHVGYNRQCGRWVFGVEGDLNRFQEHYDYLATLRGRVGIAHGRSLFYLTGGIAFANFSDDDIDGTFNISNPNMRMQKKQRTPPAWTATFERENDSDIALVLGGGAAVKLRENISLGIEGLYYFFDDSTGTMHATNNKNDKTHTIIEEDDGGFYTIKARLTYHFGHRAQEGASETEPLK